MHKMSSVQASPTWKLGVHLSSTDIFPKTGKKKKCAESDAFSERDGWNPRGYPYFSFSNSHGPVHWKAGLLDFPVPKINENVRSFFLQADGSKWLSPFCDAHGSWQL